jgi:hypothetical protein
LQRAAWLFVERIERAAAGQAGVSFVGYDGKALDMCYIVKKQRKRDAPVQLGSCNTGVEPSGQC